MFLDKTNVMSNKNSIFATDNILSIKSKNTVQ